MSVAGKSSLERDLILKALLPGFSLRRITLADGSSMRVATAGAGPTILLLHGYPETLCAWHRVAPTLARRFHIVAADLPGYGESRLSSASAAVTSPSRRTFAAALLEMMDRLGHERFIAVGHDRGARAAYRMALDAPHRVDGFASLTVIPTIDVWERIDGRFALRAPHWFLFAQPVDVLENLLAPNPVAYLDAVLAGMVGELAGGLSKLDPLALAHYRDAFSRREVREAIYRDYKAAMSVDLEHERADREAGVRIRCPVFYLWNAANARQADPLATWKRWADDVSGAGIGGGHLQPEMAATEILAHLLPFVERIHAGSTHAEASS